MSDLHQELLEVFTEESAVLLERLNRLLIELGKSPPPGEDPGWRKLERCLHTLKGASEALGGEALAREAHAAEDLISAFIEGEGESRQVLDRLEAHAESLRAGVAAFVAGEEGPQEAQTQQGPAPPAPAPAGGASPSPEAAPSPAAGLPSTPPASAPPSAPLPRRRAAASPLRVEADVLRVKPERVDELQGLVGELTLTRRRFSDVGADLAEARRLIDRTLRTWRALETKLRPMKEALPKGARWSVEQSAESLVAHLGQLQTKFRSLGREAHSLDAQATATTRALEDGIQELRLMALEPFLELFHPSVREAADSAGNRARLRVEVRGTELDRVVLLKLRDPLLHLVRNSVAHGIESPEDRKRAGKPEVGEVRLEAETEGSRAIIRVSDDGRGVDVEKVRSKARSLGLLKGEEPLDEARLLDLLVHPGFSSKESVDTLSGRGIGMDVVGSVVRGLDGQLTLSNRPGQGCTFTLDVPISTSSGRGLVARCGPHLFAFLTHGVERVLRLAPEEVQSLHGQSIVRVEGTPVALTRLDTLLGLAASSAPSDEKLLCLVLRQGARRLAVLVDDVPGEEDLQLKPLGEAFAGAALYLGGAVRADGRVVPVLQTAGCLDRAALLPAYVPPAAEVSEAQQLLVVDDSLTMRTLLRNILRSAGYRVALANNGRHALEVLGTLGDCALVLSDLEMPVMDGFELCAAIRRSDRANLPVLVISSLASANDIQRALEVGADSYIVKAELRQASFLERIAQLTGGEVSA